MCSWIYTYGVKVQKLPWECFLINSGLRTGELGDGRWEKDQVRCINNA